MKGSLFEAEYLSWDLDEKEWATEASAGRTFQEEGTAIAKALRQEQTWRVEGQHGGQQGWNGEREGRAREGVMSGMVMMEVLDLIWNLKDEEEATRWRVVVARQREQQVPRLRLDWAEEQDGAKEAAPEREAGEVGESQISGKFLNKLLATFTSWPKVCILWLEHC